MYENMVAGWYVCKTFMPNQMKSCFTDRKVTKVLHMDSHHPMRLVPQNWAKTADDITIISVSLITVVFINSSFRQMELEVLYYHQNNFLCQNMVDIRDMTFLHRIFLNNSYRSGQLLSLLCHCHAWFRTSIFHLICHVRWIDRLLCRGKKLKTNRNQYSFEYMKMFPVLNEAPRHEDVLGEWRYSSTYS